MCRTKKKNEINAPWEELTYAGKFCGILDADFVKKYGNSIKYCYVEVRINSEEDFNKLIDIATHNKNYDSIADICKARDDFLIYKDDYKYRFIAGW